MINEKIINSKVNDLVIKIESWIKDNDLNKDYILKTEITYMNDEPTSCALIFRFDGYMLDALNGYYGYDILNSFDRLIEPTDFYYERETHYSFMFFFEDDDFNKALEEVNQWKWVCYLLEDSYNELHQELYSFLAKDKTYIQKLHWRKFEKLLDGIFRNQGYRTELGPGQNDGGIDIKLYNKDGFGDIITYVQVKRYIEKYPIKLEAVAALYGIMSADNVENGIFVTSSKYLPVARKFEAKVNSRLKLKDGEDVLKWCEDASRQIFNSKAISLRSENLIKKLKLVEELKRYDDILYSTMYVSSISNTFHLKIKETSKYILTKPIRSIYNDISGRAGTETPDFNFQFDKSISLYDSEMVKKSKDNKGELTLFGRNQIFNIWDGKPLYYDWND